MTYDALLNLCGALFLIVSKVALYVHAPLSQQTDANMILLRDYKHYKQCWRQLANLQAIADS